MIFTYLTALKSEKNLSNRDIANLSGVPENTIQRIFSGNSPEPRVTTIAQIVKVMGGSLDEMMGLKTIEKSETIENTTIILNALQSRVEQNFAMINLLKKSRYISLALNFLLAVALIISVVL